MKKKYLFLIKTVNIGGAERVLLDYLKFINYKDYRVTLAVEKDIFSGFLKKENLPIEVINLPNIQKFSNGINRFLLYFKFFRKQKANCAVFNEFWLRSFRLSEVISAFFATKGNVYLFMHCCPDLHPKYKSKLHFGFIPGIGLTWRKERLLKTLLCYFIKNVLAVSKSTKESLIKHRFPTNKIKIVYHGVDIEKFCPSIHEKIKVRKEMNIPVSNLIIVSTARFDTVKRLDRLIETFHVLALQRKNISLVLAGNGPAYHTLIAQVDKLNLDIKKRVYFLGHQDNIAEILQACDIYVLPSDSEGLPIATLEAMSCGLITVVTNTGGLPEIIQNGLNGFLVEKSLDGILNGLTKALSLTPEERNKISENARRFIKSNFILKENIEFGLKILGLSNERYN